MSAEVAKRASEDAGRRTWNLPFELAAGLVGSAAFVYVVGGVVMWGRFHRAGLPPDQAVALMSRQELLVVGLRLMVLPALVTGLLAWLVGWVIPRHQRDAPSSVRRGHRKRWIAATPFVVAFASLMPRSLYTVTWLGALAVTIGYARLRVPRTHERNAARGRSRLTSTAPRTGPDPSVLIAIVVLSSATVSFARQLDDPVQLLSATVRTTTHVRIAQHRTDVVDGTYISAGAEDVFLGVDGRVVAIPRSTVESVVLGPPADLPPDRSLASTLLGGGDYAFTPFEWWCDGDRYSWRHLGRLCRTQPQLVDGAGNEISEGEPDIDGRYVRLRVRCPAARRDGCGGWIVLTSERTFKLGPVALQAPVVLRGMLRPDSLLHRAGAKLSAGHTAFVCVPLPPATRGLLRTNASHHERFRLAISKDEEGRDVVRTASVRLWVPARPTHSDALSGLSKQGTCSRAEHAAVSQWELRDLAWAAAARITDHPHDALAPVRFTATAAGSLAMRVAYRRRTVAAVRQRYRDGSIEADHDPGQLALRYTPAGRRLLARHGRRRMRFSVVFTPDPSAKGSALRVTRSLEVES